ncbi:hypothetical protein [Leifsonia sp. LS-T14]|uniref:hypothetical protein n=1 Tax=unclassified Leifsonia TaxID=2663824 RepID=UPI0035A61A65
MKTTLHPTTADRLLLVGAVAAAAILDFGGTLLTSWILWTTGGDTVVSGTVFGQVLFLLAVLVWVAARTLLIRRMSRRLDAPQRLRVIATAVDVVAVATLLTLWFATGQYYLGWILTVAALTLLLGSILRLLIAVVRPEAATDPDAPEPETTVLRSASMQTVMPALGAAVSIAVIFLTVSIHGLNPTILGGLILLIGFSALAGTAAGYVLDRTPAGTTGERHPASL